MARDYFIQTTSLVPPRGVRVEMTEIRPLRPNQAVILPGVAVLGQGLKFEVNIIWTRLAFGLFLLLLKVKYQLQFVKVHITYIAGNYYV